MSLMRLMAFLSGPSIDTSTNIGDSGLSDAMATVIDVANTLLVIIYIVLGVLLVIKGALLGVQIVKAADEPQVRQEKIGSLKWLVIGVAIGYGVAAVAQILLSYFAKQAS